MYCRLAATAVALAFIVSPALADKQPPGAKIDPKALEVLKSMGQFMSTVPQFEIEATEVVDDVHEPSGMTIQKTNNRTVKMCRKCGVHSTTSGDTERCFYFDGKTVSILERDKNMYVTVPAPDNIDKMVQEMHDKYGLSLPLSDLLFHKPDAAMLEQVEHGYYIGEHVAGGVKCHHLGFQQKNVDWQLWVEAGPNPVPRKLVITYTKMDGDPKYMVVINKWNLKPEFKDGCFEFKVPAGAVKMDMPAVKQERDKDK